MRLTLILLVVIAAGCASEQLAMTPPAGVDLSGHWRLDAADSDDPQRLLQATNPLEGQAAAGGDEDGGRRGGRGGGQNAAPSMPAGAGLLAADIGEDMEWPGQNLVIKQIGGTVAFSSDGENRVYQPANLSTARARHGHRHRSALRCGWSGRSLVVQVQPDDDGPIIEARYQLSADGAHLIQRLLPVGEQSMGTAISRVWNRVP